MFKRFKGSLDAKDLAVIVFYAGIVLAAIGAERILSGLGYLLAGFLVLLYRHPLMRWIK